MRRAHRTGLIQAACLVLLLLAQNACAATGVEVGFARPAQADGTATAGGLQWMLLVFAPSSQSGARFGLAVDGTSKLSNVTMFDAEYGSGAPPTLRAPPTFLPPQNQTMQGPLHTNFGFAGPAWSSLYIEAEAISIRTSRTNMETDEATPGGYVTEHLLTPHPKLATNYERKIPASGVSLWLGDTDSTSPGFQFGLEAKNLRFLEWHNSTASCVSSPCPDGGRSWTPSRATPLSISFHPFIGLETPNGALNGNGTAVGVVAGGPALDVGLQGTLRLPEARLTGNCPRGACPNPGGRTFTATGSLLLANLTQDGPNSGRLKATLTGAFASAAFDETPVLAFRIAQGAAVGLGLLCALFILGKLAKYGWGLFVRNSRPPALEHPRRRTVYETIQGEPGLSFRDLQRRLGWPNGTLHNHVRRLMDDGLVLARPHRNTVRYFERGRDFKDSWLPVAHLIDPDTRKLHDWLLVHHPAGQSQMTRATEAWGWSRAKTRRRLASLQEAGLVTTQRRGRHVLYQAQAAPPSASVPGQESRGHSGKASGAA